MLKFILGFLLFAAPSAHAQMMMTGAGPRANAALPSLCPTPIAIVAQGTTSAGTTGGNVTLNTTGAGDVIVGVASTPSSATATVSDNKSNIYDSFKVTSNTVGTGLWRCRQPCTVGSSHTVTVGGGTIFGFGGVLALSGTDTSAAVVDANGATGSAATLNTGSAGPQSACSIAITMVASSATSPSLPPQPTITGYTTTSYVHGDTTTTQTGALAYKIQAVAASENPQWGSLVTTNATSIIVLKSANVAPTPVWASLSDVKPGTSDGSYSCAFRTEPSYTGPLCQLYNTASTLTQDLTQTAGKVADTTGLATFCGAGSLPTNGAQVGNCVVKKWYDQSSLGNDLSVNTTNRVGAGIPNCSTAGFPCAAPLVISVTTGLPAAQANVASTGLAGYSIGGINSAGSGIISGNVSATVALVGKPLNPPVGGGTYVGAGGIFTDQYDGGASNWSFAPALALSGGPYVTCGGGWCYALDSEQSFTPSSFNSGINYSTSWPVNYQVATITYDSVGGQICAYIDATQLQCATPSVAPDFGHRRHIFNGGDLSTGNQMELSAVLIWGAAFSSTDAGNLAARAASMLRFGTFQ